MASTSGKINHQSAYDKLRLEIVKERDETNKVRGELDTLKDDIKTTLNEAVKLFAANDAVGARKLLQKKLD